MEKEHKSKIRPSILGSTREKIKTTQDLFEIRGKYDSLWKRIQPDCPRLTGKLYFAFLGEFVSIHASLLEILRKNHFVFADSKPKSTALQLLEKNKNAKTEVSEDELKQILRNAPLNTECRIELLWSDFEYEDIYQLQSHPLVDQDLTPQSKASIRIVLGQIG